MDSNLSFISPSLYLPQSFPSPPHPTVLRFLSVFLCVALSSALQSPAWAGPYSSKNNVCVCVSWLHESAPRSYRLNWPRRLLLLLFRHTGFSRGRFYYFNRKECRLTWDTQTRHRIKFEIIRIPLVWETEFPTTHTHTHTQFAPSIIWSNGNTLII